MSARIEFLRCMHAFQLARVHEGLVAKAPDEVDHNIRASALRNGIAIIGFSALEHFIRTRTAEVCAAFNRVPTPFNKLPDRLKNIATSGSLKGILFRVKFESDKVGFIQREASVVASSCEAGYQLSPYAIGWDTSNLSKKSVEAILNSFGVKDSWDSIDKLAKRLNLSIPSSKAAFGNASARRHEAAHNVSAKIHPSDLQDYEREAFAIALGFDLLISTVFRKIYEGNSAYLSGTKIDSGDIALRRISFIAGKYKEFVEGSTRASRVGVDLDTLRTDATQRASRRREALVCFDIAGLPCNWDVPGVI